MNGLYGLPGDGSGIPKEKQSRLQQFKESPAYPVLLNLTLFGLGVAFIQSPLIEMLAPQL
ncbi:HBR251Cp [Eremothecium sinecaudum]|uniref:HBR251Cp n=1 Tax=Eremothecium sinecaudum TaxID=45286 RepID=A0A109UXJ2_9SACH|nr:HBR251Cp [Eremothecium sinecaudum]AMD19152.1 HBR251Cp [Eremothecium sinecaudum]